MFLFLLFAAAWAIALSGWILLGALPSNAARAAARAAVLALALAPTIVGGHGVAIVPAWYVLFALEDALLFALVPMAAAFVLAWIVLVAVPPLRRARTAWPPDASSFLHPPAPRFLAYGVLAFLLFASFYEAIGHSAWLQLAVLLAGGGIHFVLCLQSARIFERRGFLLPLAFAAPLLVVPPYAILWYAAGLAGLLVGAGRATRALWLGSATFGGLFVWGLLRTFRAIEYRNVAHVEIQGGVAGSASTTVAVLLLCVSCLLAIRRRLEPG